MKRIDKLQARIAELEHAVQHRESQLKEAREDRDNALELVGQMREQLEQSNDLIENWIEVFELQQDSAGVWIFDPNQAALWEAHDRLQEEHRLLIRDWNRFVRRYNATITPRDVGRPVAASEAQVREVRKLHKGGASLRKIASAMGLGVRTVRTIVEKARGTDRTSRRATELRKREYNRLRGAAWRARKRALVELPKRISSTRARGLELVKAAKGLG